MPQRIDFTLYLITDRRLVPPDRTLLQTVEVALAGGVRAVQLREKDLAASELRALAQDLRILTRRHNARLLINRDIELALDIDADGVHLPGDRPDIAGARHHLGPDRLIGVSTHHVNEIRRAAREGADFVTFGPVCATPSKAAFGPPQGFAALTEACHHSPLPVFALGGMDQQTAPRALCAGAHGVALIAAIIAAADPRATARALLACDAGDQRLE